MNLILLIIPSLTYPLICLCYFSILNQKRGEVDRLLEGETLTQYTRAYGHSKGGGLFARYHNWKSYILPIFLNMFTVTAVVCAFFVHQGIIKKIFPDSIHILLENLPAVSIAGFTGAYIWGHYDMIRRYSLIDLSPVSLYHAWLRLLVSGALGYLVGFMFKTGLDYLIAFGIGAFPLGTLLAFVRNQVRERLKLSGDEIISEKPNLHLLQGMTTEIIERLHEENIYSAQHLALVNPIRLLMKTSFEWTVILDFVDQAFLYCYVGDKLSAVRETGIRGAIEFMSIGKRHPRKVFDKGEMVDQLVSDLAKRLEREPAVIKNMIDIMNYDDQLQFIYKLWLEAFKNKPKTEPILDK